LNLNKKSSIQKVRKNSLHKGTKKTAGLVR